MQTSTEECKNKKKKREPVKDVFLRCYHCRHPSGHRESCWGAQGTEEKRCPEVAPGNPE